MPARARRPVVRPSRHILRRAPRGVLAAALAALTACSEGPTPAAGSVTSLTALTRVIDASRPHGPTEVHVLINAHGGVPGGPLDGEGDIELGADGRVTGFRFDYAGGAGSSGAGSSSIVVIGSVAWVRPGARRVLPAPAKTWLKLTLGPAPGAGAGVAGLKDQLDLRRFTTFTGAHTRDFQAQGPIDVDGTRAWEYSVTVDVSAVGGTAASAARARQLAQIPVTYAVDDRGRLVRVTETVGDAAQPADVVIDLRDYGESVPITPPPADQVQGS